MASGVVPGPKVLKADKGTMVSVVVAMEAPVEVPPRPLDKALSWAFSADWAWMLDASAEDDVAEAEAVLAALVTLALLMALLLAVLELTEVVPLSAGELAAAAAASVTVPATALV